MVSFFVYLVTRTLEYMDLKSNFTNPMRPPPSIPLTLRYMSFYILFIVNKALNLIGGCVPCVSMTKGPTWARQEGREYHVEEVQ